jgi:hypothetical protein
VIGELQLSQGFLEQTFSFAAVRPDQNGLPCVYMYGANGRTGGQPQRRIHAELPYGWISSAERILRYTASLGAIPR